MKKKVVVALFTAVMALAFVAGCGQSSGASDNTAADSGQKEGDSSQNSGEGELQEFIDTEYVTELVMETDDDSGMAIRLGDGSDEDEAEEEENYNTGDASQDKPRNEDGIGETELLVVSFGTSYNNSRVETIGAIEQAMEDKFTDLSVRRAFTSQIIIDHVKKRDGEEIDNVEQALNRAVDNGVKKLVVQPTHLMNGLEYEELQETLAGYSDSFEKISVGEPLLTSEDDFKRVEEAIVSATKEYDDGETAICFMGHGTEADSNQIYSRMQELLTSDGYEHYYVGTVEAAPSVEDVLAKVKEGSYKRVVLRPLMIVAGDHANNDMAGDEEDSWKTIFQNAGYQVECVVEGLGSIEDIQKLLAEHAQAAVDKL